MPRHWHQQQFIIKEFLSKKDTLHIKNTAQVDSLFSFIDNSWKKFVADSLINATSIPTPVLNNLDAYSYLWTIGSLTAQNRQNREIEFHLFKNYMLPSLIKDFQFVSTNPTLLNENLIWVGSLGNTLSIGARHYNDSATFVSFYALAKDLKTLLLSFIKTEQKTGSYANRLLNILNSTEYELESKRYFLINQPDLSFTYLITGISTNKFAKPQALTFAKSLVDYYHLKNETDKSLAILNDLALGTTNDELSRDTLKAWYTKIDSIKGVAAYDLVQRKLTGKTYAVLNEKSISVPKNWNLIANNISAEKLKNARFILIDFWYSACSPCIAEIPSLNELFEKIKNREDVIFISVNTDFTNTKKDESSVKALIKKFGIQFPVAYENNNSNLQKQLKVEGYPSKFILNKKGQIITKADNSVITLDTFYDFLKSNE
jgi:thiol-disulfide isomerase/thioredoxin